MAQEYKLNFFLKSEIKNGEERSSSENIHLNVKGETTWIKNFVLKNNGNVKYATENFASIVLPLDKVKLFSKSEKVDYIDFSLSNGRALNDSMLHNNNVIPIHNGELGIPEEFTGKDVILGFIDTGVELEHEDFKDSTGNTRVLAIWDQGDNSNPDHKPSPYNYGSAWDSTDINAGNCPQKDFSAHGSTVVGSAASNGRAVNNYKGIAPESEIIMVKTNFYAPNWLATVADGIHFIFSIADELNKPCVINLSIGDYYGSHDGKDLVAQYIDALLAAKRGRSIVCAAGNSGDEKYHLNPKLDNDSTFTWFKYNGSSALGYGSVFFEVWADTVDFNDLQYTVGADKIEGSIPIFRGNIPYTNIKQNINKLLTDTIKGDGGNIAIIDYYAELRDNRYLLQVHLAEPDSNQYNFRFITKGTGTYDIWTSSTFGTSNMVESNIPDSIIYPDFKKYVKPDANKTLVNSWACSPHVITVANYQNRISYVDYNGDTQFVPGTVGKIVDNSSWGPSRTGLQKPDIAASGNIAMSSVSFPVRDNLIGSQSFKLAQGGMHLRNGGTSMASPVIAGIAALILQRCPNLNADEVLELITASGKKDEFTGELPNNRWGFGKVDAFMSIKKTLNSPTLKYGNDGVICDDDSIKFEVDGGIFESYFWDNGVTKNHQYMSEKDTVSLIVEDSMGCKQYSDTIITSKASSPKLETEDILKCKPDSIFNLTKFTTTDAENIGYYFNLEDAKMDQNKIFDPQSVKEGKYFLNAYTVSGCSNFDSIVAGFHETPDKPLIIVNGSNLSVSSQDEIQWYFGNEPIANETLSNYKVIKSGWYKVMVTNSFNCSSISDSVNVVVTEENHLFNQPKDKIKVIPNPASNFVWVVGENKSEVFNFNINVLDLLGRQKKCKVSLDSSLPNSMKIEITNLQPGIYLLKINSSEGCIINKLIKE